MTTFKKVLGTILLPFKAVWILALTTYVLLTSLIGLLCALFIAYWVTLTFSYIFLPTEWTLAFWDWGTALYEQYTWFRVATIAAFELLLLPILGGWPGKDPVSDAIRKREAEKIDDDIIAARQREKLQLKLQR